jgi:hypothetical protein
MVSCISFAKRLSFGVDLWAMGKYGRIVEKAIEINPKTYSQIVPRQPLEDTEAT